MDHTYYLSFESVCFNSLAFGPYLVSIVLACLTSDACRQQPHLTLTSIQPECHHSFTPLYRILPFMYLILSIIPCMSCKQPMNVLTRGHLMRQSPCFGLILFQETNSVGSPHPIPSRSTSSRTFISQSGLRYIKIWQVFFFWVWLASM